MAGSDFLGEPARIFYIVIIYKEMDKLYQNDIFDAQIRRELSTFFDTHHKNRLYIKSKVL